MSPENMCTSADFAFPLTSLREATEQAVCNSEACRSKCVGCQI
jgi:hypothetical protein